MIEIYIFQYGSLEAHPSIQLPQALPLDHCQVLDEKTKEDYLHVLLQWMSS